MSVSSAILCLLFCIGFHLTPFRLLPFFPNIKHGNSDGYWVSWKLIVMYACSTPFQADGPFSKFVEEYGTKEKEIQEEEVIFSS